MSAEEQVKYLCLLLLDGLHGLASVNVGNLAIRGLECQLHMRRVSSLFLSLFAESCPELELFRLSDYVCV